LISLFTVFFLQGLIMWIVAMPIQVALAAPASSTVLPLVVCGTMLWTIGIAFETIGDLQLACFKAKPENANRVMDRGLWRYTRHPNYFGDFCVWWGLYFVCASHGAWWTVFSPVLMSVLLLHVSGVTLLESTITSRRPEYADYQCRTNAFFPWRPRS
jgi:steroid 5-alpha reductase family enzyme